MTEGYIKLYRILLDNPIFKKSDYLSLWIHLLLMASHKETSFIFDNKKQTLKAGQLITGRKKLSKQTGINENQVYKILNYLELEQQIEQQKNNHFTLISILNWDKYQGNGTAKEQQKEQPSNSQATAKQQPSNTYKNDKNVKNDKNIYIPVRDIVELYNSTCQTLPKVSLKLLSDSRKKAIALRWHKFAKLKDKQGVEYGIRAFEELFTLAHESDFISGRNGKWTSCNFDWLLNEKNMVKVLEGTYDNR